MENLAKALDRFVRKIEIEPETGCWLWQSGKARHGYGSFWFDGGHRCAHRWAYEHIGGSPLVPGLVIDHLCSVTGCVNPNHLEQVTQQENLLRGFNLNRSKTHCKRGHLFDENNTRLTKDGRVCIACQKSYDRARYLARKAAVS